MTSCVSERGDLSFSGIATLRSHFGLAALLLLGISLFLPSSVYAQPRFPRANGESLTGVRTFNTVFEAAVWANVQEDQDEFQRAGQAAFELGLRRDGVGVEEGAPNFLICSVGVAESRDGLMTVHMSVEYFEHESDGVQRLLWETGGMATAGETTFSAERVAETCVDYFTNEWLRWNPR